MKFLWIAATLLIVGLLFWPVAGDSGARAAFARAQIDVFRVAIQNYRADTGEFPTEAQGLRVLRINLGVHGWKGPYLVTDIPRDPWGEPYQSRLGSGGFRVFSLGGGSAKGERAIPIQSVR